MPHHVEFAQFWEVVDRAADFIRRQKGFDFHFRHVAFGKGISLSAGRPHIEDHRFIENEPGRADLAGFLIFHCAGIFVHEIFVLGKIFYFIKVDFLY